MARLAQVGLGQWGKNLARNFGDLADLFVRTDPTVTVYYGPGCDVIEISVPCSAAIQLAIDNPRPAPSVLLRAVSSRKKRR